MAKIKTEKETVYPMGKTAILVDGAFFIKRVRTLHPGKFLDEDHTARILWQGALKHLLKQDRPFHALYRIFFYDSVPSNVVITNPVDRRKFKYCDLPESKFRSALHEKLKQYRKVALRLGELSIDPKRWSIAPTQSRRILSGTMSASDIKSKHIKHSVSQKGVDIKIGLDIASLSFSHAVDQIILISGDSDFVPAAKMARRSGIDFILDPMWNHIRSGLIEHIDGLQSPWPKPVFNGSASS